MNNSEIKLTCLNCGWIGKESDLIEIQWVPDDNYIIEGEMISVCPKCKSPAWEEINEDE